MGEKKPLYDACKCITRPCPDKTIDEALLKQIATNFRTLPSFENMTYSHIYRKHYSLRTNEFLKCRWKEYKAHAEERVYSPFQFPDVRDFHFYQGDVLFNPSLTVHKFSSFRNHLKPGPGVDKFGQMPIPDELFMERGLDKKAELKNKNADKALKKGKDKKKTLKNNEKHTNVKEIKTPGKA